MSKVREADSAAELPQNGGIEINGAIPGKLLSAERFEQDEMLPRPLSKLFI
jgi:hypothetical protein